MEQFTRFAELHHQEEPLFLGNVWDVPSAKAFENAGYSALGTSSAAIAANLGYPDGEQMPWDMYQFFIKRIAENIKLPFSVNMEGGYGNNAKDIAEKLSELAEWKVAGVNLEDSFVHNYSRKLKGADEFADLLREVKSLLSAQNIALFLNIRTDAYVVGLDTPLEVMLLRIRKYETAGADGIFVPCLTKVEEIKAIVQHTQLPLNVMAMPNLPTFDKLKDLGVKRISAGNFFHNQMYQQLEVSIKTVSKEQSFQSLFI